MGGRGGQKSPIFDLRSLWMFPYSQKMSLVDQIICGTMEIFQASQIYPWILQEIQLN